VDALGANTGVGTLAAQENFLFLSLRTHSDALC
jgi:hypothetical protein